ncbi:MAG: type I-D CRISPR-associated protein Cas7/Csc2 [Chloroflexi bacterium]|nr:type I-D CRISPR-associated protein Cas7/Csc2 [Chloroflexota bacterium]
MTLESLQKYARLFVPTIPRTPTARYASVILLRETKSYAIFTTEGGEQQDVEQTPAGLAHAEPTSRLVMFKRKQVAPERRTGKALLRQYGVFPYAVLYKDKQAQTVAYGIEAIVQAEAKSKGKGWSLAGPYDDCYLIAGLCSRCPDCLTYGYAAIEGEGARKSRVMTDTSFTVRPYELIQKQVKFNVIDEATHTSGTITEYDYTTPGVFLPAVETTVDLTAGEFVYVLGNILRTTRYGKESTRQGYIRNHVLAIALSDVELFSNLEFTQAFYDALVGGGMDLAGDSLALSDFEKYAPQIIEQLTGEIAGRLTLVTGEELAAILTGVRDLNRDEGRLAAFLKELNTQAASFVV